MQNGKRRLFVFGFFLLELLLFRQRNFDPNLAVVSRLDLFALCVQESDVDTNGILDFLTFKFFALVLCDLHRLFLGDVFHLDHGVLGKHTFVHLRFDNDPTVTLRTEFLCRHYRCSILPGHTQSSIFRLFFGSCFLRTIRSGSFLGTVCI